MKRPKKLLYQVNRPAYSLLLLFIACLTLYTVTILKSMTVNYLIAAVSLVNVVMLLVAFLTAEEIKVYNHKFQFVPLIFAIVLGVEWLKLPEGVAGTDLLVAQIAAILAIVFALASSGFSFVWNRIRARVIADNAIDERRLTK